MLGFTKTARSIFFGGAFILDFSFQHVVYFFSNHRRGTSDKSMAGKKAFHPDHALKKAMDVFLERGYEGTSVEDLVQETRLWRGSLDDTLGYKHALYLSALDP